MENDNLKNLVLQLSGTFHYGGTDSYFVQTVAGNFIWFDPEHGGNNTMVKVEYDLQSWLAENHLDASCQTFNRLIKTQCGIEFTVIS